MRDKTDIYSEKNTDNIDWYVSVRFWQIVLCSILTLILCLSFRYENGNSIKDGYDYLTGFSITKDDIFDTVETLKNFIITENGQI